MVDPNAKLEEELIVRPTSEAIIWSTYKGVQSYRDLPLLINQWANVVRWEMRTSFVFENSRVLWQEGHTAHATKVEAVEESEKMMNVYADFAQNLYDSGCKGIKTETERFVGRGNILYRSINAGRKSITSRNVPLFRSKFC
jgi:prolyl-tRNA synthetase